MLRTKQIVMLLIAASIGLSGPGQHSTQAQTEALAGTIVAVVTQISLTTHDIIYNPVDNKIYASIPSSAGGSGNSVVPIDVPTGTVGTPIFVGSEPNKLAISDDGNYLYVGLNGAAAVRRVNLISQTAEIQFSLGSNFCGSFFAEDIVVLKDNPNAVAISRSNTVCSPRHEGVAIYDDGIMRPITTPGHTGSNVIEPSDSSSILYGYNSETTEFGFYIMSVFSTGITVTSSTSGLIYGFNTNIRFGDGLIYATTGAVIDPSALALIGTYDVTGLVYPDSARGLVYFLSLNQFKVFNQTTFVPITSLTIPGVAGTVGSLIKVGQDLFAFRTSAEQVFLIKLVELNQSVYLPIIGK